MIEIHDVLEYKAAARLHVVPKNQNGLQSSAIINRIVADTARLSADGSVQEIKPLRLAFRVKSCEVVLPEAGTFYQVLDPRQEAVREPRKI
jgi:hypothetical protein